ncbi:hypothetical protein GCM10007049_11400 [Echinicola pacifica]|uniref:DUF4870 domain-containing protein n=2 Tax=Echinicola pacifica TaxID=346377 RepID=A0A918UMA2_9BACT|nr:hypothetical protein GCM10007049_11400 [Echinicola pacifica]
MSLIAAIAGLPLPIVNLLATLFFYLSNRKGTYFVRWHCTQALVSQVFLLGTNSVGFWWTVSVFMGDVDFTNQYMGYMVTLVLFNLAEFAATIYTAIQTRKGIHVEWWFYGNLTHLICPAK